MNPLLMTNRHSRRPISYSGSRARKGRVRELVSQGSLEELAQWAQQDRYVLRPLLGLLFDTDELICWRTIHTLGLIAPRIFAEDRERIRLIIRQQFWHMNDESGNVGWYAPQVIGEIVASVPALVDEYARRLPPFFVEEPFERGSYWAVARIAECKPEAYRGLVPDLIQSCADEDPYIRYHSLRALGHIDENAAMQAADRLKDDDTEIKLYDRGRKDFVMTTIAGPAQSILNQSQ
jgi:hypothetical protein